MQTLNASMDGAVTAEAGREFQSRTADGKKEPLYAFTEQYRTKDPILWPLVDAPDAARYT